MSVDPIYARREQPSQPGANPVNAVTGQALAGTSFTQPYRIQAIVERHVAWKGSRTAQLSSPLCIHLSRCPGSAGSAGESTAHEHMGIRSVLVNAGQLHLDMVRSTVLLRGD